MARISFLDWNSVVHVGHPALALEPEPEDGVLGSYWKAVGAVVSLVVYVESRPQDRRIFKRRFSCCEPSGILVKANQQVVELAYQYSIQARSLRRPGPQGPRPLGGGRVQ